MTENMHVTSAREDIYRLLAVCYYSPAAAFMQESCADALAGLLEAAIPEAGRHARAAARIIGEDLESLAVEHARLFIGPFQLVAPPYGSIYLDESKTVMGESTGRVAAFYRSCGLILADDFHELPDHIAVELEFISFLAFKQREAEISGNAAEQARIVSLQREFLGKFLLPWLEPFTLAIINDAESPFYVAIAHCTAAFIAADYAVLTVHDNG